MVSAVKTFWRMTSIALCASTLACGVPQSPEGAADETGNTHASIRSVTNEEALADFDQMVATFRSLYGATERKEQRYRFKLDEIAPQYRNRVKQATTEPEYVGIFQEFISRFRDAHVSLQYPLASDNSRSFSLPFKVMPVGNTFVIYSVNAGFTAVQAGDEVLSIDGVPAQNVVQGLMKYAGFPSETTGRHIATKLLTSRPSYLSQPLALNPSTRFYLRGANGQLKNVIVNYREEPGALSPRVQVPSAGASTPETLLAASESAQEIITAEMGSFAARVPYFMTPQVKAMLGISEEVAPSPEALAKFGLTPDAVSRSHYYAATYALGAKKVLFVRIPSYMPANPDEAVNYLRALFSEQEPKVDGLVLDESHNSGGSLAYAADVLSLLTPKPLNGLVQRMHADRMWIQTYLKMRDAVLDATKDPQSPFVRLMDERARTIDTAYSSHQTYSTPIPFFFDSPTIEPDETHWSKPAIMLVDELSVSCADFVPAIIKANGRMPLFGETTMGGGGNVEAATTLINTRATLNLSRGLGSAYNPSGLYPEESVIEDNGVSPDVSYSHTLADYRAGYVGYVKAFNAELAKQLK